MAAATVTQQVSIGSIKVPEYRKRALRPEKVREIAESIKEVGLLEPPVITEQRMLIAGNHRLEACRHVGMKTVTCVVKKLSDVDRELAEIDENLIRAELTALEHSEHVARRKELYLIKYPETARGGDRKSARGGDQKSLNHAEKQNEENSFCSGDTRPFTEDTASKTGRTKRTVELEVQIGSKLNQKERDRIRGTPLEDRKTDLLELARTEDPKERKRILDLILKGKAKSVAHARREIVFENQRKEAAKEAREAKHAAIVRCQDATEFLLTYADQSVDLLLTDPPYETDVEDIEEFVATWIPEAMRVIKPTGRGIIWTGMYPLEMYSYLVLMLTDDPAFAHVLLDEVPLVWTYRNTIGPIPKHSYKRNGMIAWHLRGVEAPPLEVPVMTEHFSVQEMNAPDGRLGNRYHAWQKPDELCERLIRHCSKPKQLVVDPFCGTGSFLLAAARLARQAEGSDNSTDMIKIAVERGCRFAE